MIPARQALERLREGNRRYAAHDQTSEVEVSAQRRAELATGQEPFAVVLGCSDSRVPAEMVFDQGLGDLFVIRVAGNVASPEAVGSAEFAATKCGTRLVVVMGHSGCGGILATLDAMEHPEEALSPGLTSIVDHVRPAIEGLTDSPPGPSREPEARMAQAVRANVRAAADHLRQGSAILASLIEREGLVVVGAEYDLESGVVDFFDGVEKA